MEIIMMYILMMIFVLIILINCMDNDICIVFNLICNIVIGVC